MKMLCREKILLRFVCSIRAERVILASLAKDVMIDEKEVNLSRSTTHVHP